jgi:predicted enzyme related to lactoylglutathione lyase
MQIIPILPCGDISAQIAFYQALGFELESSYASPNAYAVMRLGEMVLHFYGTKKHVPEANATMCYVTVSDLDALCDSFTAGLKSAFGKIPRSGLPRITKVRELVDDRRFSLSDPAGNTFYIGAPRSGEPIPARTLKHAKHAKAFAAIYDIVHSKEDYILAKKALAAFESREADLNSADLEKVRGLENVVLEQSDSSMS